MIYFILLILTCPFIWAAPKNLDLNYGIQGRTLPSFGAELYADSGYSQLLWGKKEGPKDVLYGLLRPSLTVSTSGVINAAKGELEFFPISFIGIAAGHQIIHSNYEFPFFDCEKVACKGEYSRDFIENKMVIGYKGWVALGNYKVDVMHAPHQGTKSMADWRNVIIGDSQREVQIEKKLMVGKVFGQQQMIGSLIESVQFQGSRERKESFVAVYQFKKDDTFYLFGAGGFHTNQVPMGFQFYFRIHHIALPSLKLF